MTRRTAVRRTAKGMPRPLLLPSGRSLEMHGKDRDTSLRVVGPSGRVELTMVFTEAGPKFIFESADIELHSARAVSVACESFDVRARGDARIVARSAELESASGNIALRANDHVVIVGEQIRLNCDKPDEMPPWMEKTLAAELADGPPIATRPASDITGDAEIVTEFDRMQNDTHSVAASKPRC